MFQQDSLCTVQLLMRHQLGRPDQEGRQSSCIGLMSQVRTAQQYNLYSSLKLRELQLEKPCQEDRLCLGRDLQYHVNTCQQDSLHKE